MLLLALIEYRNREKLQNTEGDYKIEDRIFTDTHPGYFIANWIQTTTVHIYEI